VPDPNDMMAKVAAARKAGYSDQQIGEYLEKSPQFAAAKQQGYSDSDIWGHFGLKMPTADTDKATAQRLMHNMPIGEQAKYGVGRGLLQAGAGVVQTGLDVAGMFSDRAKAWANDFTQATNEALKALPTPSMMTKAGDVVGQAAPYMLAAPESAMGAALMGGAAGGTQFDPSQSDRLTGKAVGATAGAVTGGVLSKAGNLIGEMANTKAARRAIGAIQREFSDFDPAIAAQRGTLNQMVDKLHGGFVTLSKRASAMGDAQGPINMADVEPKLRAMADSTGKMLAPDKKAVSILDNAVDVLAPDRKMPKSMTINKQTFFLDPTGQYVTKDGVHTLPPAITAAALKGRNIAPAPDIRWSQMKQSVEEMNTYLENARDPKNPATAAVREARDLLQKKLDSFSSPTTKAAEKKASRFYAKNVAPYQDPAVKGLLEEPDPLRRANTALSIALGDDPNKAELVAGLVGEKGQQAVFQGAIKKALDSATSKGVVDAGKFVKFFDNKAGLAPFMSTREQMLIKGVRGFLDEDKLARGGSEAPSLGHPTGQFGLWVGIERLLHGDVKGAAVAGTAAVAVRPTFNFVNRMLNDHFGQDLLMAASRAKPGTARMSQLMEAATRRFGPAAGQAAADRANAP